MNDEILSFDFTGFPFRSLDFYSKKSADQELVGASVLHQRANTPFDRRRLQPDANATEESRPQHVVERDVDVGVTGE